MIALGSYAIELEEVRFTGGIKENKEGFYREIDPSQPQYVGAPSPEIDKAWEDLYFRKRARNTNGSSCSKKLISDIRKYSRSKHLFV